MLEVINQIGWQQIELVRIVKIHTILKSVAYLIQVDGAAGSQVLLQSVETYAAYVGDALVNMNVDTGNVTSILLTRSNIGVCVCV